MANEQLKKYVVEQLARGVTAKDLEKVLLAGGWPPAEVNDVLGKFNNQPLLVVTNGASKVLDKKQKPFFKFTSRLTFWGLGVAVLLVFVLAIFKIYGNKESRVEQVKNPLTGFSHILVNPAYAMDSFTLTPQEFDTLGVTASSGYVLKSKTEVPTELIRKYLKVEPAIGYQINEVSTKEWLIKPKQLLVPNTLLKISLATSYSDSDQERDYAWAYQVKDHFKILSSIPRQAAISVPSNSGIEITFSHENFTDFSKYFSIEPTVEGKFEQHHRTMVFVPASPLKDATIYTVSVRKGLPLIGSDEILPEDYTFSFETAPPQHYGENTPWFEPEYLVDSNTLEQPMFQVYSSSLPGSVKADVYKLDGWQAYLDVLQRRDRIPWWSYTKTEFLENTDNLKQVSTFDLNIVNEDYLQYVKLPAKLPAGYYIINFFVANLKKQSLLQVSNLAAYLSVAKDRTIVWANDIEQNKPISGAAVDLINVDKQYFTTNSGVAVFTTPEVLANSGSDTQTTKRYYLKVQSGEKVIIMPASSLTGNWRYNYYEQSDSNSSSDYWTYLYTDRPQYQTTDAIKFWGLIQDRQTKKPAGGDVWATLYKEGYVDYYYQPVRIMEKKLELTDLGTFIGEFKYNNLRPDYYTLELKVGNNIVETKYINIQPYTKPAYQIKLIPDRSLAYAGENIKLNAKVSFFDGTPVPDLKLNYRSPDGDKIVMTDEEGNVELNYTTAYKNCAESGCWPAYATISVNPAQEELADITAETTLRFYGPKTYLTSAVNYPAKGLARVKMTTRLLDLNSIENNNYYSDDYRGKESAPNVKIEGELTQTTYQSKAVGTSYDYISKRTYTNYEYIRNDKVIDSFSSLTDRGGFYYYQHATEPNSSYRLRVKTYDQAGRFDVNDIYFYYSDGQVTYYPSEDSRPYYHLVVPENKQYAVGEDVPAVFMNKDKLLPSGGPEHYLYLQYQNGLQEYYASNSPEYSFNFTEKDVPNVSLLGIYFNGTNYIESSPVDVRFNIKERALKIEVTPDKSSYAPGDNVNLMVKVTNKNNQPVAAEVNLNLIDEAYYAVVGDTATPLESIYASVSSGIIFSNSSHQPFVSRFSGAEKGGGGDNSSEPRDFFTDAAVFKTVDTNSGGVGTVSFQLPDNITSWRITAQSVSHDLYVGDSVSRLPVSLPVFVDVSLGTEYLSADKPLSRVRAYGTTLNRQDAVQFDISAPTLGGESSAPMSTTAFMPVYYPLPKLTVGKHDITYKLATQKGSDAVTLPIQVIASRLLARDIIMQEKLTSQTKLKTVADQPIEVVLSDEGQNQLYQPLLNLSASWGDRVDQSISRKKATVLLNSIYKENYLIPSFSGYRYQLTDGGIALLPYSSADLELSARLATIAKDEFDQLALRQYFFDKLENTNSNPEEITLSLYGLAALGEPVLPRVTLWLGRQDLKPLEKLYLTGALEELGASEESRQILIELIKQYGFTRGPEIALKLSDRPDDVATATALAASLASALSMPERDGLWSYVTTHPTQDVLLNLEQLSYISKTLPTLKPSPAQATYSVAGREEHVTITGGQAYHFTLESSQINDVKFKNIEGDISVSVSLPRAMTDSELSKSKDVSIRREYWVNGQVTNIFHENDAIEVRLYPTFSSTALPGDYELIDLLPSGFSPVTKLSWENYDCHVWYPYDIDGQRVRYRINKDFNRSYCGGTYIKYYARVKSKGAYLAEPAILQSFRSPDIVNHSAGETITIE